MRTMLLTLLAFLSLVPLARAGDELPLAAKEYGFDGWPGKDGTLKQGVALGDVDMAPWVEHSRRSRLATSGETIVRYSLPNGKPAFEVAVRVLDTVAGAQEHLLGFLGTSTVSLPRGDLLGLAVGDVSFAAMDGPVLAMVAYARNNVFVRVSIVDASAGVDVADVAARIDGRVVAGKDAKGKKGLGKPRFVKLAPGSKVAQPGEAVEVSLVVVDPLGGKVDLVIDEGGAMVYEKDGRWYFQAEKPLSYTVTVYAVNDHMLVTKKSFTIKVAG